MQSQNYSFVVRVWLEGSQSDGKLPLWRGSIERVGSDYRIYFSDPDEVTRFIQKQIGLEPSASHTRWHLILEAIQNGVRKFWKRILRS